MRMRVPSNGAEGERRPPKVNRHSFDPSPQTGAKGEVQIRRLRPRTFQALYHCNQAYLTMSEFG